VLAVSGTREGDGVTGVTFATGPGHDNVLVGGVSRALSEVVTVPVTLSTGPGNDSIHAGLREPVLVAPVTARRARGSTR
jgi:hypothetical protein